MEDKVTYVDGLFELARTQEPKIIASDVLNQVNAKLTHSKLSGSSRRTWLRWLSAFGIPCLIVAYLVWANSDETYQNQHAQFKSLEQVNSDGISKKTNSSTIAIVGDSIDQESENSVNQLSVSTLVPGPLSQIEPSNSVQHLTAISRTKLPKLVAPDTTQLRIDDTFRFPTLTEEQIAQTLKHKKLMVKQVAKQQNKVYSYIPSGTYSFDGEAVSVQSFFMRSTEVTNLEYRTFLFDLLIQGRKADFIKAKPNQEMWTQIDLWPSKAMQNQYFSNEAYNEYPVVNVPFDGAWLYCRWLTMSTNEYLQSKDKEMINDIRLPSPHEFRYAASSGGKLMDYPWPPFLEQTELPLANYYTPSNDSTEQYLLHSNAHFDNEYGLRNMSGNCAEWSSRVTAEGIIEPQALGGGWMDELERLKVTAAQTEHSSFTGHPNVGFRVVFTYLSSSQ